MTDFSPREIVSELDRFIIGQGDAKRAVAIALRNRWRRMQLDERMREEVLPKNILMIGPTGVGKTEISRRLAKLAGAPFLKVEATKFTEVGYVGRDVEQIVRDLVEIAITQTRERKRKDVKARAEQNAEDRVVNALVGENASASTKDVFRKKLRAGELNDKEIEVEVQAGGGGMPLFEIPLGTAVHNVELKIGRGGQLCRGAGTSAQVVAKEGNYVTLRLRSTEMRMVRGECLATIGEVGNAEHELLSIGKAGKSRWLGRNPRVRGVAMNPVDHPLGGGEGKSSGGRPPTNPWGKVEGKKTRHKKKQSTKLIVRGRKRGRATQ